MIIIFLKLLLKKIYIHNKIFSFCAFLDSINYVDEKNIKKEIQPSTYIKSYINTLITKFYTNVKKLHKTKDFFFLVSYQEVSPRTIFNPLR